MMATVNLPGTLALLLSLAYGLSVALTTLFCLVQLFLLVKTATGRRQPAAVALAGEGQLPLVTVQLPLYNEPWVAGRLLDQVMLLDYPRERFEVQVLDDSTDETGGIVSERILRYRRLGYQVHHIRRGHRSGYKAGALREGMELARGDFIAIFDADFLPRAGFLRQVLGHFSEAEVGVVQVRWEHLNERYNLLTRLQALQLNVHFLVEQPGRAAGGYLLQFNGSAGVWRREAIEAAGNWEADTLTEDLDLSIRAQLRGWRIVFLTEPGVPSELPAEVRGLRSQQFRWMKGGAESARKLLGSVWRSSLPYSTRLMASFHLLGSSVYLPLLAMQLLSWPLALSGAVYFSHPLAAGLGLAGLASFFTVQFAANVWMARVPFAEKCRRALEFLVLFPLFLAFSLGLSVHNFAAVVSGWRGKRSEFVRTPKFNIIRREDKIGRRYRGRGRFSMMAVAEWGMLLCTGWALWHCWEHGIHDFLVLHLLAFTGLAGLRLYELE